MKSRLLRWALVLGVLGMAGGALAQRYLPPGGTSRAPAGAGGTVIVPDQFLRRWDPITVFFAQRVGPRKGGPEDSPERYLTLDPPHPGAFTWLDGRTLQFRPAEPWPPLGRFSVQLQRGDAPARNLATLMPGPKRTQPAAGATDLGPLRSVTLTFSEPLDITALRRMVSLEVKPLPGIGEDEGRWLDAEDFAIKALERRSRSADQSYELRFSQPLPLGSRITLHLRLSLDDGGESFARIPFSTAEPFRVLRAGCGSRMLPVISTGSRYGAAEALRCGTGSRRVSLEFSARPQKMSPMQARSLVRITPPVDGLEVKPSGRRIELKGRFAEARVYRVSLHPTELQDVNGRPLDLQGESVLHLFFPENAAYLKLTRGDGILERFGPQRIPAEGRGHARADLRIYSVDPLDLELWPFPSSPIDVDESGRPPGPGEEPEAHPGPRRLATKSQIQQRLRVLGAPPVSTLVDLPLAEAGGAASFGVDLAPHLKWLGGERRPGHYLVGLRRLDASTRRSWMRVQVTDLSLTTLEETQATRFVVSSLSTSRPVSGAEIRLEGYRHKKRGESEDQIHVIARGRTGRDGSFVWKAPGLKRPSPELRRIVVEKDGDTLVLDPARPPEAFSNNRWRRDRSTWLKWALRELDGRGPKPKLLCHVFTERPVYRPEHAVHIKGWLRRHDRGELKIPSASDAAVIVEGPGGLKWRYPVELSKRGGFYHRFTEEGLPTGTYQLRFENERDGTVCRGDFRMEAYRLPRFEVQIHGPAHAPLDREFEMRMTASYYAGGKVAGRPVQWRVTQFPLAWTPPVEAARYEDFVFSSDQRFSAESGFQATPTLDKRAETDDDGAARLLLNPAIEPTAQARTYVVEATVVGEDDQSVTSTRRVKAVPPFVLGLKLPRFLEEAEALEPAVVALGPDGKPVEGIDITLRLKHRQWHSRLQASDFTDGKARYVTEVVDDLRLERALKSGTKATQLKLPIESAGVYLVELEARDRLGRAQVVSVDLFAAGDTPLTWERPERQVFEVVPDRDSYEPGARAKLLLKSPFQRGRVLAVTEGPRRNRYQWLQVEGGKATFELPIEARYAPKVPVHFVLIRGRVEGSRPIGNTGEDPGAPRTLAATKWLRVESTANRVELSLKYPEQALPGEEIEITVEARDPQGRPRSAEVALWLVDQAVLALGKEARLDPLPDYIRAARSYLRVHDTRNLAFGSLPLRENPGGGFGDQMARMAEEALLDQVTVRRRFEPVPYYEPALRVGASGRAKVRVTLPDNLTNFKLRAKAASGDQRFGFASGRLRVRLPVIVQPALPRFARPGDELMAGAIARVVEGKGGPASAQLQAEGVALLGEGRSALSLDEKRATRFELRARVESPTYDAQGQAERREVTFRAAVKRRSDGAADAYEVKLPLVADRRPVVRRMLAELARGEGVALPPVDEAARPGSVRRRVLISDQPALLRMSAAMDFLTDYPYGCAEQRLSRARAQIALRGFRKLLALPGDDKTLQRGVADTLEFIASTLDDEGLVAYWPGADGYVSLTAWALQFIVEAKEAGFEVDAQLERRLVRLLKRALRSDYRHFVDGESWLERSYALSALAAAGQFEAGYADELARRSEYLDLEGSAQVLWSLAGAGLSGPDLSKLQESLWDGVVWRFYQGREVYGGLQKNPARHSGVILPSETRTVAEILRAQLRSGDAKDRRLQRLVDALVTLGGKDGWGSTNANASALLALSELLRPTFRGTTQARVEVTGAQKALRLSIGGKAPAAQASLRSAEPLTATLKSTSGKRPIILRAETRYLPAGDGSQVAAESAGFVVRREQRRVLGEDMPDEKYPIDEVGQSLALSIGDVIEEHVEVVNASDRYHVAVIVPLAAGLEPLNPALATAPPEAQPRGKLTRRPTYAAHLDDHVGYYFDFLPKGSFHFYFRAKATTEGRFIQPPAQAEMMYDAAVFGRSPGARVVVAR